MLAPAAGSAVVIPTADGARLVHEAGPGNERRLRSVALDGDGALDLGPRPRRPPPPSVLSPRRRGHEPPGRLGPAGTRWPPPGRPGRPTARSSATSRTARPSRSMRPCDDHAASDPGSSRTATVGPARRLRRARSAARAAHGPDPVERRRVRPEPGPRVPLACGLGAGRRHQDRHQGRGRRRQRHPSVEGGDVRLRRERRQPDRLWSRRDMRRQRSRLLHAGRPDELHDVAPRAGPRLRLGDAEVVPGLRHAAERVLRRRERSPSTSSVTSKASAITTTATDNSDYLDAVVQTYSRTKPSAGWNAHAFGRCDVATLQMMLRHADLDGAKYSTCLDLSTVLTIVASPTQIAVGGSTTLTATLKVVDFDGVWPARRQPVSGRTVTLQRRAVGATTWIGGRDDADRVGLRHLCARPAAGRRRPSTGRSSRHPASEGINGDSSPAVRVDVDRLSAPPDAKSGDPGPVRLIQERSGPDVPLGPLADRHWRFALLASALLACACAGASPSMPAAPSLSQRRRHPRRRHRRLHRRRRRPSPRRLSAAEPPAAALAVEGGDPVTGQLGTFTWGDGGSDSPWLPGAPIAVGTGEQLTVSIAGARRRGHLVRQTGPRRDDRRRRARSGSERAARRSPSTPRRPGRGRSR